jgi:hypothetical protein
MADMTCIDEDEARNLGYGVPQLGNITNGMVCESDGVIRRKFSTEDAKRHSKLPESLWATSTKSGQQQPPIANLTDANEYDADAVLATLESLTTDELFPEPDDTVLLEAFPHPGGAPGHVGSSHEDADALSLQLQNMNISRRLRSDSLESSSSLESLYRVPSPARKPIPRKVVSPAISPKTPSSVGTASSIYSADAATPLASSTNLRNSILVTTTISVEHSTRPGEGINVRDFAEVPRTSITAAKRRPKSVHFAEELTRHRRIRPLSAIVANTAPPSPPPRRPLPPIPKPPRRPLSEILHNTPPPSLPLPRVPVQPAPLNPHRLRLSEIQNFEM